MAGQGKMTRDERLAAKLRENLRRRKAQARELDGAGAQDAGAGEEAGDGDGDSGESLPKADPSR